MDKFLVSAILYAGGILLAAVLGVVIVFLHEVGHAVAAILLTRAKATIYIGSYGDPRHSVKIGSRWLDILIRYNPRRWGGGLCVPHVREGISWRRTVLITLAGPMTTFIVGCISCYAAFAFEFHPSWKYLFIFLLLLAIADLIVSLTPINRPIQLYDGGVTYRDGYTILQLVRRRNIEAEWAAAIEIFNSGGYADSAVLFTDMLRRGMRDKVIYHHAIVAWQGAHDPEKAYEIALRLEQENDLDADDLFTLGTARARLALYDEALLDYEDALLIDPDNSSVYNNRGYTFNLLERYSEAIDDFDRAIELEPEAAYPYCNRGLAKIKLGRTEEGVADIRRALELDDRNSYAYRNLGIYHFDQGEFSRALELFEKARELDEYTHMIDDYIGLARGRAATAASS